ncbi:type II and III secretion system protein family protein [Parendozoicomonas haliclonae]|uniref:Type II secretion system protein D n=1 Tax=Parendozoicomonas haliclonae TaxID=1960125 RepID=A0A1X7AK39_9GAMM|nr:type II and III secretion system protein family protein [Parendozoicomonas haliclonae]SMA47532.1 Type II secretion system protein D precursor [Parendozoicomonas haliclonae]
MTPYRIVALVKSLMMLLCALVAMAAKAADNNLYLDVHKAEMLHYSGLIDTVFVADPQIADYRVINNNRLVVYGKQPGSTSLLVTDAKGNQLDQRTLVVTNNLSSVKAQLKLRFPDADIALTTVGDQVVLSGTVASDDVSQDVYKLTGQLLGKKYKEDKFAWKEGGDDNQISFMTRYTYEGLVNNLQVDAVKQLNVKLTIAEVSHSFIRQLGVKFGSLLGEGDGAKFIGNGQFFNRLGHLNSSSIGRFISAADDDAMGQILAEPNLSVLSGETASFLAGGEMPIITYVEGSQNIHYKEFGVRLTLAAKVHKDSTINLSVEPEVSSVDVSKSNNKLDLPAFKTRRTRTTIQLADGESFVLGGLISAEDRDALSKVPFAGDIPILGAAFRHTDNQRQKTELIIVATVNLVKPVKAGSIQLPQMNRVDSLLRYFNLDSRKEQPAVSAQAHSILATGGFKQ